MPVRIASAKGAPCDAIIDGLKWAGGLPNSSRRIPAKKADIINMSFGSSSLCPGIVDTLQQLTNKGVTLIAAAGNSSTSQSKYPASLPYVISVSATNKQDVLATYSNYGTSIDIAAPGGEPDEGVLSTAFVTPSDSSSYFEYYTPSEGTSMASP